MTFNLDEKLHRLVKGALDTGLVSSVEEGHALFRNYRLSITFDGRVASSADQAALLTCVALASRVFLGGVTVEGRLDIPMLLPTPSFPSLAQAVEALGAQRGSAAPGVPMIAIGGPGARREKFHVRLFASGWRGGVLPIEVPIIGHEEPVALASALAAALSVHDAFRFVQGSKVAGRQALGLSLWNPASDIDWTVPDPSEPRLEWLPSKLWLIGLGHLGQAYLWALSLLPYRQNELELVLQDVDRATPSTQSTSILTDITMAGQMKTRICAAFADSRGFVTKVIERRFASDFRRNEDEPAVAICGVDNPIARRALEQVGFGMVVEAGLGSGAQDFRKMRLHVLPGPRTPLQLWPEDGVASASQAIEQQAAYSKLLRTGELDACGVTLLAGKAVGAPFVGTVAATLALAEVLRPLHGGRANAVVDLDLESLRHRHLVPHPADFSATNFGFIRIDADSDRSRTAT